MRNSYKKTFTAIPTSYFPEYSDLKAEYDINRLYGSSWGKVRNLKIYGKDKFLKDINVDKDITDLAAPEIRRQIIEEIETDFRDDMERYRD